MPELNLKESPLSWLYRHKDKEGRALISRPQFEAGERLREDFTFAQILPQVTMNWSTFLQGRRPSGGGGAAELSQAAMAARERVYAALDEVGPDLSGVLVDVCCFLKSIGDVERERGWPVRSGKVILLIALSALARHYGLCEMAKGKSRAPLQSWGTKDFRPSIS